MKSYFPKLFLIAAPILATSFFLAASFASAEAGAHVYFKAPKNGETVTSPVTVQFGVEGMIISPAGEVNAGEGHHHLIVDGGSIKEGEVVPTDATHLHYGKGQTEASIPLTPGKHKLTMQFADGAHHSYGEKLSATIEVNVK